MAQVRHFQRRFRVANEGPEVTTRLLALLIEVPTRGRRIHDANIVATMLVYGVRRLLTNNADDFVRSRPSPFDVLPISPTPAPRAPPPVSDLPLADGHDTQLVPRAPVDMLARGLWQGG